MSSPKILALTAVAALFVLGGPTRAQAQTIIKATVPFEFRLDGQLYPAGTYTLESRANERSLLAVRNWAAGESFFVTVQPDDRAIGSENVLKFNRYGDRYFLSSIVIVGDDVSLTLPRSKAEREMASRITRTEVAVVAANQ
jgi:hypothetical protein